MLSNMANNALKTFVETHRRLFVLTGARDVLNELFPIFVHRMRRDRADLLQLVHDMGRDVGVDAFIRQQTAIIGRADSRPTLATISCPTLVLTGDQDLAIPNSLSKEMVDGVAGAKLVILSQCGHLR
jgi:pimeloyl-ACP methyl ester carboxylesterase